MEDEGKLTVREARIDDAIDLARIISESFSRLVTPRQVKRELRKEKGNPKAFPKLSWQRLTGKLLADLS